LHLFGIILLRASHCKTTGFPQTSTGNTLDKEFHRTGHSIELRSSAIHTSSPSPLFQIYFWRLILDETQYIDREQMTKKRQREQITEKRQVVQSIPKTQRFKVAMYLHSAHRWCVSGTPFNTLDDLRTLLVFLRHDLANEPAWGNLCASPLMTDPSFWKSALHLWRNSNDSTQAILALPGTTSDVLVTSFSSVEREVYYSLFFHEQNESTENVSLLEQRELSDLLRTCLHPSQISDHGLQRLGIDATHTRPNTAQRRLKGSNVSDLISLTEIMKRLVSQGDEDLEEARLEWYIAMNDFADHALFYCNDHSRAFELYSKGFELSQDTVVSYPHNLALQSM
jgi:SNF2 family DNA or RNA helicase